MPEPFQSNEKVLYHFYSIVYIRGGKGPCPLWYYPIKRATDVAIGTGPWVVLDPKEKIEAQAEKKASKRGTK